MNKYKKKDFVKPEFKIDFDTAPDALEFPVEIFPEFIQLFINDVCENTGFSKDFLSVSIMSTFASVIGQSVSLKVDNTWETTLIFWFAVVGETGSKKSHPVKFAIKPLSRIDIKNKEQYDIEMSQYDEYTELSDNIKKITETVHKPKYIQFIVNDATIEALFHVHSVNKRGLLIYKDELLGWINGMGQYKAGKSDEMEKFLSLFDGDELKINRVTKEPLVMGSTNVNMIGTIQPEKISLIPKENGALHRFLFTNADKKIKRYNKNDVNNEYIKNYYDFITQVNNAVNYTGEKIVYEMTSAAKDKFTEIDEMLCNLQEADNTDPLIAQYCEKLKTYTPRFALLIFMMDSVVDDNSTGSVGVKHLNMAFEIVKYFLNTAQILFFDNKAQSEAREIHKSLNGKSTIEKIIEMNKKGIKVGEIKKEVDVSRAYIYKILKKVSTNVNQTSTKVSTKN